MTLFETTTLSPSSSASALVSTAIAPDSSPEKVLPEMASSSTSSLVEAGVISTVPA
jgi:hypothetical protein